MLGIVTGIIMVLALLLLIFAFRMQDRRKRAWSLYISILILFVGQAILSLFVFHDTQLGYSMVVLVILDAPFMLYALRKDLF